jgi:hypothetical protein
MYRMHFSKWKKIPRRCNACAMKNGTHRQVHPGFGIFASNTGAQSRRTDEYLRVRE